MRSLQEIERDRKELLEREAAAEEAARQLRADKEALEKDKAALAAEREALEKEKAAHAALVEERETQMRELRRKAEGVKARRFLHTRMEPSGG